LQLQIANVALSDTLVFILPEIPMPDECIPQLSIIVPLLNEADMLPSLFATLVAQRGVRFELVLCDGGSHDDTLRRASELADASRFRVKIAEAPRGRGRQMNAGAVAAGADILLFLHADSVFDTNDALARSVSALRTGVAASGFDAVAGRFALSFRRQNAEPSLAYLFYEAKARLNRSDCIRGDQGFMLSRAFFRLLGGFDEQMPYLEDLRFVDSVASKGSWLLFPAGISTSARRFETEGLLERQVVNAIIVNCLIAGWPEFFSDLAGLYRFNSETGRLSLFPILDGIRKLLARQSTAWRRSFWNSTGHHVAANAWQPFFWLDVQRAFAAGQGSGTVEHRWYLRLYERFLERFFLTRTAATAAALLVKLWHHTMLVKLRPPK
jgi:rSAM/selenodomain-associated transferase 2